MAFEGRCSTYFFWPGVLSALAGLEGLADLEDFFLSLALASDFTLVFTLALALALALVLGFFWLGVLGVSLRSLGESSVPRQLALPHQQGYSALSFLV